MQLQADSCADYTLVSEILTSKLAKHPRGAFFLFFHARFQLVQVIRGQLTIAQLCQQGTVRNDHLTTPYNVLGGYLTNQGLWISHRLFVK